MSEDLKKRYNFSTWSRPSAETVPVLLKNFTPWKKDCLDWSREREKKLTEMKCQILRRSFWTDPKEQNSRVLIEARETASATEARKSLLEVLSQNQYLRLPEGPSGLGEVCFVHPDGAPPAVFLVIGNLCLSVVSFGLNAVNVVDWGCRFHSRVIEKPRDAKPELTLSPRKTGMRLKEEQAIAFTPPTGLSEEAFYKFFASGAELFLLDGELHARALRKGEAVIEGYVVDPGGREAAGRAVLAIK